MTLRLTAPCLGSLGAYLGVALACTLGVLGGADAQAPTPAPTPTATPAPALDDASAKLASGDPALVREGIDLLGTIDDARGVPPLKALLDRGQPDPITDRILTALGGIAKPEAIDVLEPFTRHRRPAARVLAFKSIGAIRSPRSRGLVERGLSDSDRSVRAAAATLLGDMNARASVGLLFRALDRGVLEGADAIGRLGDGASVATFHESLGKQPIRVMLSGYRRYLERADISAKTKENIVVRLSEVAGPEIKSFFTDLSTTPPRGLPAALVRKMRDTAKRIRDVKPAGAIKTKTTTTTPGSTGAPSTGAKR